MTAPEREALVKALLASSKAMVEIDDRDALTDPDRAACDEYRAEVWGTFRAAVKAMDSAAPAVTVTEGWQPIETAPKDGSRVLLMTPPYGAGSGHWDEKWRSHFVLNSYATPTHWQPLPPPPSTTPQTGSQE